MMTLMIIIILMLGTLGGARNGFIIQAIRSVIYSLILGIARSNYLDFAQFISTLVPYPGVIINQTMTLYAQSLYRDLDQIFYNALAYILIVGIGWFISQFILFILKSFRFNYLSPILNVFGGGIIGLFWSYLFVFFALTILSFIPLDSIQSLFMESGFLSGIIRNSPFISTHFLKIWTVGIEGIVIQ